MATTSNQAILLKMPDASRRNTHLLASNLGREETCPAEGHSLASVVTACQNGDLAAYRQLYDSCHQVVFRLAVRMVGLQDAADVTQQVFLQAFRSISKFHGRSRFETWLYRLAVNESLQYLRRQRRGRHRSLEWEPVDETLHPENSERKELIEEALSRIDPKLRSIFLLREVQGFSYQEIAEATGISEGTVGSRLNRARRELKQHLTELGCHP